MNYKSKYLSSAFLLLLTSVIVKIIGAVYKIPLTSFIGAVGRGYFAAAYNLYLPLHTIIMGSLPIALSRLVSKSRNDGDRAMLTSLRKGSRSLFFTVGVSGTALLMLCAKPYSELIAHSPGSVYTVLVIAPGLLFSCLAASYRGYYEGFMNMMPTSVSQTLEALFKMVFGLLFARLSMAVLYNRYLRFGTVFGTAASDEKQALACIYPFTSAAAMLGVTLGSLISLIYVASYHLIKRDKSLPASTGGRGRQALLEFSFPILLSCAVQSVFQFLDTASIQYSLSRIDSAFLINAYSNAGAAVEKADSVTYAYGLFSTALDFKNLVPGVTMALGVCAVPAICAEYEGKQPKRLELLMNSVYKYTSLLSVYGGLLIGFAGRELLEICYASSAPDIVDGCEKTVVLFSYTVPVYALASTAVFCVQAVGKPEKSVFPYVLSGAVRCVLNIILISNEKLILTGAVISGSVGYTIIFILNAAYAKRIAETRFDIKNIIFKPAIIGLITAFLSKNLFEWLNVSKNLFFNLLIKFSLFSVCYYILCIFFGVLNFKEIFCVLKRKKMA